ncbi:MAG TPA: nitrogenase component 1 [Selenomonadales bacterium]|nr:nitrogenase component 1 [Selenomonadales bacterium]
MIGHRGDDGCTRMNTCAWIGAAAFFAGIPDAVVVTAGPGCCDHYAFWYLEHSCPGAGARFYRLQGDRPGLEEGLPEVLQFIRENVRPSVLVIGNGCSAGPGGDVIAGNVRRSELSCPVIFIDGHGLTGGFGAGYRAAAAAYWEAVPPQRQRIKLPNTVNLLGCTLGYYNAVNDIRELRRMLNLAGHQVMACPGAGSSVQEIAALAQAELNLVVHAELGGDLAQYLWREYGIPYLVLTPPYGIEGSLNWLKALWMDDASLQVVQREADSVSRQLCAATLDMQKLWGELWFERTLIAAPASVAFGMAQTLRSEWADTGPLTVVIHDGLPPDPLPDDLEAVLDGRNDEKAVERQLAGLAAGLLLASNREKSMLRYQAVPDVLCQNIALPVFDEIILGNRPFMGLRGAWHMTERLWNQYISFCQRSR